MWSIQYLGIKRIDIRKRKRDQNEKKLQQLIGEISLGIKAIKKVVNNSWFEWDNGSSMLFWKWLYNSRKCVTKCDRSWVIKNLPKTWGSPWLPSKYVERAKSIEKVAKLINIYYLEDGFVKSLTGYFAVPKGEQDISVVYNASKSMLNDALWAPNCGLPIIKNVMRNYYCGSWF